MYIIVYCVYIYIFYLFVYDYMYIYMQYTWMVDAAMYL